MSSSPFHQSSFQKIKNHLLSGKIAILPTDTIPGFSADPRFSEGIEGISQLKNRPPHSPYILLVQSIAQAKTLCEFSKTAENIAKKYWPGSLTLLLPRRKNVLPCYFPYALELALRIPSHFLLRQFLTTYNFPIVSTSVNIAGSPPLLSGKEIRSIFSTSSTLTQGLLIPDFPISQQNTPSTLVRIHGENIGVLREGVLQNISE